MCERDLYDSVLRSPNGNNYTWNRGNTFSKLDYIFVSADLLDLTTSYDTIWDLVKSDHAAIKICIKLDGSTKRGKSYPKLFLSDIKSDGAIEHIKNEICKAIDEFPKHWNPHQKLDFIKVVIRTNTLELRSKNKISTQSIELLPQEIDSFKAIPTLDEQQSVEFNNIRSKLYKEEEVQSEKLRIMAGIKWAEEGELSTKFFLNSINSKRAISTVDYLNTENGPIHNIKDILLLSKQFYEDLYAERKTAIVDDFYKHCPKLSDNARESLCNDVTIADLKNALKSCKDSTPGLDGIPYSFYKIFGTQLLPILLESWKFSIATGKLPQSQSTSVISLIPKAGKDKHDIRNWRPISISPCDLKIITKALSIKVGSVLGEIISDSQMGYVPGRDINFNNRLMNTALNYCNNNDLDYVLMSLDAQKAYDSIDHSYICKTLETYGFPESFISTVNLLHNSLQAHVQVNGFLSDRFCIKRGVKQGDALSCALFIISIDPLIRNIENNHNIPALNISSNCALNTLAYADDIAIITQNSDEVIQQVFNEYESLTHMSGLTLNAEKTEILNLCTANKLSSTANYNHNNFSITHSSSVTICGNLLSLNKATSYEHNISNKISKLKEQLNRWKSRNLSINGKMIVLKAFAISQLIFSSQFQTITKKDLKRIEHLCYSFVWNGTDHVKRGILKSERHAGGINGIDVESFFYAITLRQFFKSNSNDKLMAINQSLFIKEDIKTQARTKLRRILLAQINNNPIDSQISAEWISQTRAEYFVKPYSKIDILMYNLGITNISSINPSIYSRGEYNSIRRSLSPGLILVLDRYLPDTILAPRVTFIHNGSEVAFNKLSSRILNDIIKKVLNKTILYHPSSKFPLESYLFTDIRNTWQHLWQIRNPTLRAIRLKILYKDVWCQEKRFKLKLNSSDACNICGEAESAIHQLFQCSNARKLWSYVAEFIGLKLDNNLPIPDQSVVNLIQVLADITSELIKSVIFKLLIQIDRSVNITKRDAYRTLSYWLSISKSQINKRLKGNNSESQRFESIVTKLNSPL